MADTIVELKSSAARCKSAVHRLAARLINGVAHATKDDAIEHAPEETGFLISKIKVTREATSESPEAAVESGAEYSAPVNFGHHAGSGSFVAADPFFSSAVERAPQKMSEALVGLG